ncbi:hypothetical protein LptCag_0936 [Leptospirillum ferriphilum]|uniref:Uncharacterized protein n=1 Tax=Leptospirillum ferriphilum TaxID=178606 RepID=A0A094YIS6_9BACT|nr:hypothetical protein LptCag_0936 [Leptospirillum ferriphilum]
MIHPPSRPVDKNNDQILLVLSFLSFTLLSMKLAEKCPETTKR